MDLSLVQGDGESLGKGRPPKSSEAPGTADLLGVRPHHLDSSSSLEHR